MTEVDHSTPVKEYKIIAQCFSTSVGKKAYKILMELFEERGDYEAGDAFHTVFLSGQRDMALFIKRCVEQDRRDDGD